MVGIPIIIGIDPGTTLGFAVLGVDGKLIDCGSSKMLDRDKLISRIMGLGSAIAVSSDKKKTPSFVEAVGIRLGARIISPDEDLMVRDKRQMVSSFNVSDDHQRDALASAVHVYKTLGSLLRKIRIFIRRNGLEEISDELYCTVVRQSVSLSFARDLILSPERKEVKVVKEALEHESFTKAGYIRLYDRIKEQELTIEEDKRMLAKLRKRLAGLEKDLSAARSGLLRLRREESREKSIAFRDKTIRRMGGRELRLKKECRCLKKDLDRMSRRVMDIHDFYVLKKVSDLGKGFEDVKDMLQIKKGDMLIVEDPSVFSEKVIKEIKGRVDVLIGLHRFGRRFRDEFITIDGSGLRMSHFRYFSLVKRKALDKAKYKQGLIEKIVDEYKKERAT